MSRHIDIIATAVLLLAIAAISTARQSVLTAMHRHQVRVIQLENATRQVRLPRI